MPPSKDRMWTAWFMETQFNIIANERDYLEIIQMKVISASRKQLWSSCQQSATSHFNTKRDEEASLDTQNCIDSVVLKPILCHVKQLI